MCRLHAGPGFTTGSSKAAEVLRARTEVWQQVCGHAVVCVESDCVVSSHSLAFTDAKASHSEIIKRTIDLSRISLAGVTFARLQGLWTILVTPKPPVQLRSKSLTLK